MFKSFTRIIMLAVAILMAGLLEVSADQHKKVGKLEITHGPVLGKPTAKSMGVWARTSRPARFAVFIGHKPDALTLKYISEPTSLEDDNTGIVNLTGLKPDSLYYYAITLDTEADILTKSRKERSGYFRTLPEAEALTDPKHNPNGLFNFSFEFACGNNQTPRGGLGPTLPGYNTLNKLVKDRVHFAVLNGDWLYEEDRDYQPESWLEQVGLTADQTPRVVKHMPNITGVWENYKTYLHRAGNLAEWHRHVPSYYTFDDHELLNDVFGSGETGYRNRRAVFRDVAIQAWYDYLGWSNPVATPQTIKYGEAQLTKGSDILVDKSADFTKVDFKQAANLHVHWSTRNAGVKDIPEGDTEGGDPNANVYEVVKVIDKHRLQVKPAAVATKASKYSIGQNSHGTFKVANCRFFLLDTRTYRELHDIKNPGKKGLSMLGRGQREWLMDWMKKGDADFYFVISSVNFMVPHVGGGGHHFDAKTKDDAWTVFLEEREMLIDFWDKLGKKVFVLTGDLHNSFAIKITDNVWEFASGPHNSVNHRALEDEGGRPVNGPFKYGPRPCFIKWSTTARQDIPKPARMFPHYCVVKINNVYNAPKTRGGQRYITYPIPHVIFQYFDALTGEFKYSETVHR